MTKKYSNIKSQQYCTSCGSFDLERTHRGFVRKVILRSPILYRCNVCNTVYKETDFQRNEAKQVPLFIE